MTIANSERNMSAPSDASIASLLDRLECLLNDFPAETCAAECCEAISTLLRALHAKIRTHHASDSLDDPRTGVAASAPELCDEMQRLRAEHHTIFGLIDRLVRSVDAMPDLPLEDKHVFIMRVREMVAVVRRHEAEEDRLLYLAVWRDTGGES